MHNQQKKANILFVDDEVRVVKTLKALFRQEYNVFTALNGNDAIDTLANNHIDVVVSDQRMPEMSGSELLSKVCKAYPHTVRLLLTGFSDKDAIIKTINQGEIFRFINKPWVNNEIKYTIADAVRAAKTTPQSVQNTKNTTVPPDTQDFTSSAKEEINIVSHFDGYVVVVAKDQNIRNKVRRYCQQHQIQAFGASTISQIVKAIQADKGVGLIVYDISADGNGSVQMISVLKEYYPEIVTIALTTETDTEAAISLINTAQVYRYLKTPLSDKELFQSINDGLNKHLFLKNSTESQKRYFIDTSQRPLSSMINKVASYFKINAF